MADSKTPFDDIMVIISRFRAIYDDYRTILDEDGAIKLFNVNKISITELYTDAGLRSTIYQYVQLLLRSDVLARLDAMVSANPIYFNYRIKLEDSIETKIWSYVRRGQSFAVRKSLNDIVGGRIIMSGLRAHEDDWLQRFKQAQEQEIVRPYIRDDAGYHALHLYIQGGNKYLPWEIQIWDQEDRRNNFAAHDAHEQRKEGK